MKKILKRFIIFFVVIIFLCFLYLKYGGYLWMDKDSRLYAIMRIKDSPSLPDRFYDLYNMIYSNTLNKSQVRLEFDRLALKKRAENPCLTVAYSLNCQTYIRKSVQAHALFLENFVNQKECLNFHASRVLFQPNVVGIDSASSYFYQKELKNLTDDQMIELIVIMENPSYYNPKRRPQVIKDKVKIIKKQIEYASK